MKNFVRALRHTWPYRRRFAVSVVCAALAAVLWGLNFTCIYPVLKLLNNRETPQQWVDGCIDEVQADIDKYEPDSQKLQDHLRELEKQPTSPEVEKQKSNATSDAARVERRLAAARAYLWQRTRSPANTFTSWRRPIASRPSPGSSASSSSASPSSASSSSARSRSSAASSIFLFLTYAIDFIATSSISTSTSSATRGPAS